MRHAIDVIDIGMVGQAATLRNYFRSRGLPRWFFCALWGALDEQKKKNQIFLKKTLVRANIVVHNVLVVLVHFGLWLGFGMEKEALVE